MICKFENVRSHLNSGAAPAEIHRIESPKAITRFLDWLADEGLDAIDSRRTA